MVGYRIIEVHVTTRYANLPPLMSRCASVVATNQGFGEDMVKATSKVIDENAGRRRRSPRKTVEAGDTRTERLVLRVHPDLIEVLTVRARERGITRSAYVEQLLIGWVRLDPRNRRLDMIGKIIPGAQDPEELKRRSAFSFAERWSKFATVSRLLLGAPPPSEWVDDGNGPPDDLGPADQDYDEDPTPPSKRRR